MRDVLGLDLSLTSTGWSCSGESGVIASKLKDVHRLIDVRESISSLVVDRFDRPAVVVEGYSFASRNSQSHSIGELGGVVKVLLTELGIPFVVVPPTVRAKFATGRGNASKNEVISAVSARTGIVYSGKGADDMCDAFVLEEMGRIAVGRGRFEWPALHLTALSNIDWKEMEKYCAAR